MRRRMADQLRTQHVSAQESLSAAQITVVGLHLLHERRVGVLPVVTNVDAGPMAGLVEGRRTTWRWRCV